MGSADASMVAIVLGNQSIGPLPARLFCFTAEKSVDADVADSSEFGSEICIGVDSVQDRLYKSVTQTSHHVQRASGVVQWRLESLASHLKAFHRR